MITISYSVTESKHQLPDPVWYVNELCDGRARVFCTCHVKADADLIAKKFNGPNNTHSTQRAKLRQRKSAAP